jgi:hypothetical protein
LVSRQAKLHAGQTPCVSNVFQTCRHLQIQRELRRGRHLHFGQRMRRSRSPTLAPDFSLTL